MAHLKRLCCVLALLAGTCLLLAAALPLPTAPQLRWHDLELGVIIHFDPSTFSSGADRLLGCTPGKAVKWTQFAPTATVNVTSWAAAAAAFGAKYAILAAKHACGFTLWPTKATFSNGAPYQEHIGNSGYAGHDLAREYVDAFRAMGILPGMYYSVTQNTYLNVWDGNTYSQRQNDITVAVSMDEYVKIVQQQITELWSNYGNLTEIWFDGGYPNSLKTVLANTLKLQPNAVAFSGQNISPHPIRWSGTEGGSCPEPCWSTSDNDGGGDPNSGRWNPAEADIALQNNGWWFFNPGTGLHSVQHLVDVYHDTVGRNANYIIDIAIPPSGTVADDAMQRYAGFGSFIRGCYGQSLASTSGTGNTVTLQLSKDTTIDRVVLQEDQSQGQRVRAFTVTALSGGKWVTLFSSGKSIGHKKIVLFGATTVSAVQLNVQSAADTPIIRNLAVHYCALCQAGTCQNGGTCSANNEWMTAQCTCPMGYTGKYCETVSTCGSAGEGGQLKLSCTVPGAVISQVSFASYGLPSGSCPDFTASTTCNSNQSLSVVSAACLGKSNCSVAASNDLFGDPCFGTGKTLAAKVLCEATCNTASEGGSLTLSCAAGQINKILFASYGTPSGTCPAGDFKSSSCHAANSSAVVSSACLAQSGCSLSASNAVFGDPCSGTGKKLAVQVSCLPTCALITEYQSAYIGCPSGAGVIQSVAFASYGLPSGSCNAGFGVVSSCHANSTASVVESTCLGKSGCLLSASNSLFGDPCSGTQKRLAVSVKCSA